MSTLTPDARRVVWIFAIYLVIAFFQVGIHWFLSTQSDLAHAFLKIYLYHEPHSHKGAAGYLDFALPAILLGASIGLIGARWSVGKIFCLVVLTGLGIVGLTPIYAMLIGEDELWWWPKTSGDFGVWLIGNTFMTYVLMAVFTYGGHVWLKERDSTRGQQNP